MHLTITSKPAGTEQDPYMLHTVKRILLFWYWLWKNVRMYSKFKIVNVQLNDPSRCALFFVFDAIIVTNEPVQHVWHRWKSITEHYFDINYCSELWYLLKFVHWIDSKIISKSNAHFFDSDIIIPANVLECSQHLNTCCLVIINMMTKQLKKNQFLFPCP